MSVTSMAPYNNAITSSRGGGGGNNNAIADNDNENSIDPNPYVFPYFHADGTTPLLYELVVTHFGNHHTTATTTVTGAAIATTTTTTTSIPQSSLNMFTSNAKTARRLKSRCLVRPIEAGWADSCGDTVLHRLSQLVRFDLDDVSHYFTNDGTFLDIGATRSKSRNGSGDGSTSSRGLLSCSPPNRMPCASSPKSVNSSTMTPGMTNADLILLTQRYLMEAEPKAVYAVNNWGETYLHQFVSHCGFSTPSSSSLSATTATIMKEEEEESSSSSSSLSSQPSMCYLETLLQAFPESACRGNYLKALPLHEACGLPQLESNNNNTRTNSIFSTTTASSSSSLDAVEKFGKYLRKMILAESSSFSSSSLPNHPHRMKRTATTTTTTMENHHLRIIQRLLEYYPVGVVELDAVGRSPLCRAIQSKYCSSDVVLTLLEEMEVVLERNVVRSCCTCNSCESCSSVSLLLRAAILGQKAVLLSTSIDNTVKGDKGDDCSVGSDGDDDDTNKSVIVSPLEELWNIWLEPKNGLEHLYWWIDHHNQQTFPTLPMESSTSQMVEACLHTYPFPTTTTEGALKEFRKKEQMVASHLLCKLGHLWKKTCHLMLTVYKGSVSTQSSSNPRHRHRGRQNSNNDTFMFEADVEEEEEEGEKSKECISGEGGLVHAAILCSSPRCILNLATRMYPEELIAVDEDGNTPLCMLLSSSDFWRTDWCIGNRMNANNYKEESEMSILNCILWSNPHAAGIVNRQGRLPLHLALSRGLQWYNGICDIFYANPSAVSIHDPITKLFPFMQVAVTDCKTESGKANIMKADGDVDHMLTTTFELLRADPAVLLQSNVFF